ncbi:hypothetical protein [Acidovorax cattleyae]|uniref:hypothetical protein n=1 Tax=Paracidovorax cattleyae TaxID=80868 RepID=UPI001E57BFE3
MPVTGRLDSATTERALALTRGMGGGLPPRRCPALAGRAPRLSSLRWARSCSRGRSNSRPGRSWMR